MNQIIVSNGNKSLNSNKQYIKPKQSANSLFKFVKKPEHLYSILEKMAIIPRYNKENIEYMNIGMTEIAFPMVCFCDINLHRMGSHIDYYGSYGIAFSKKWGIDNKIQPIQYINPNSELINDFSEAFRFALKNSSDAGIMANYILTQMNFLKPISGKMNVDEKMVEKNFTDECEWRYIPKLLGTGLPGAITEEKFYSVSTFTDALKKEQRCWLKFSPEDIKYIIIYSEEEKNDLILKLKNNNISEEQIYNLISKIIVWSEAKEDF